MERKVPFARATMSLVFLAAFSAQAVAGGTMTGGATIVNQLLNNAQLITMQGTNVAQLAQQLTTAQSTMQQLRQLGPSVVSQMTGLPIMQVQTLANAQQVMSGANATYQQAAQVLMQYATQAQQAGVTPTQLLQAKANVAQAYGGQYAQEYNQEQAKLAALNQTTADVQQQAANVGAIDSSVSGLQTVASQNVKIQGMLVNLNQSVETANSLAAQQAQAAAQAVQQKAVVDQNSLSSFSSAQQTSQSVVNKTDASVLFTPILPSVVSK